METPVAEKVLAAVRTAANTTEIREYPMPDVPADAALLKMEVAGICGTDVRLYQEPPTSKPTIMGHENIGTIAKCGAEFTRRKGFKEGDLVFLEHYVMCGKCEWCHKGEYRHCENTNWRTNPDAIRYGYTSDEKAPHLWGGFAQYVYMPWNAVLHHVPKGVSPKLAGIVTDGDLRRHMGDGLLSRAASEVMTPKPRTVAPDTLASVALATLQGRITALFVVDDGRPVGIVHVHDLLRTGAA